MVIEIKTVISLGDRELSSGKGLEGTSEKMIIFYFLSGCWL